MEESRTIEQRLLAVEDHIAICQLVGAYGYAIDGRNKDVLGRIYAEDGVYAVGDTGTFAGREAIQAIADMPGHIALVEAGCAHISTNPQIVIDGDRASATCHTMVGAAERLAAHAFAQARGRLADRSPAELPLAGRSRRTGAARPRRGRAGTGVAVSLCRDCTRAPRCR